MSVMWREQDKEYTRDKRPANACLAREAESEEGAVKDSLEEVVHNVRQTVSELLDIAGQDLHVRRQLKCT